MNFTKTTYKLIIAGLILVSPIIGSTQIKADSVQNENTVTNEICQTVTSVYGSNSYGSRTVCDITTQTGFIDNEIIAISAASFMIGISALFVNNYVKTKLS